MAKILLLEPDRIQARIYSEALVTAGHKIIISPTSEQAVFAMDNHEIDLVIVELQIALHNGLEFIYEIRSYPDWQNTPIILHTQVDPKKLLTSSTIKLSNIADILYKPTTKLKDLIQAVEKNLSLTAV